MLERDMRHDVEITSSSGNVFADLDLPNPEERLLKARLAIQIQEFLDEKGWTQHQAAEALGIDQPAISKLLRGRLAGFSVERLLELVRRLGHDIEVRISREEHAPEEARLRVYLA